MEGEAYCTVVTACPSVILLVLFSVIPMLWITKGSDISFSSPQHLKLGEDEKIYCVLYL